MDMSEKHYAEPIKNAETKKICHMLHGYVPNDDIFSIVFYIHDLSIYNHHTFVSKNIYLEIHPPIYIPLNLYVLEKYLFVVITTI